jgi:hypothetical protein
MSAQSQTELVDRLIELYCDWRAACAEVRAAYAKFTDASSPERSIAHAVYGAALDREESAANVYERQLRRVAPVAPDAGDRRDVYAKPR